MGVDGRAAENPEGPMTTVNSSWSTPCLSWNSGTQPSPSHNRRQWPPVLLVWTQAWQENTDRETLSPSSHACPITKDVVFTYWTLVSVDLITHHPQCPKFLINSGQYKTTFKCNNTDGDGKTCGSERSLLHSRGQTVSTTLLFLHDASM